MYDVLLVDIVAERLVHWGGVDNLVHVEHSVGIPALFHLSHEFVDFLSVDKGYELAAQPSVAVLAAEAPAVLAHQHGDLLGYLAEQMSIGGFFHV